MEIHTGKQWDFPKMHLPEHILRDIMDKGVTRNYNTKISEKLHVILKAIYLNRTNFKDTEAQVDKRHIYRPSVRYSRVLTYVSSAISITSFWFASKYVIIWTSWMRAWAWVQEPGRSRALTSSSTM